MSETSNEAGGAGPSHRGVEIGVAVVMALPRRSSASTAACKVGIGWGAEGPQAGFFPFYVGLIVIDLLRGQSVHSARRAPTTARLFARWGQLRQVLSVVMPTAIYVAIDSLYSASMSRRRC